MLNEVKSAFGGKKLIGVFLGLVLLLVMASPASACRGCWSRTKTRPGYAFAGVFCYNPEESIPPAIAIAPPSDDNGRATARATSIVIMNNEEDSVTSTAIAIANTGGNR